MIQGLGSCGFMVWVRAFRVRGQGVVDLGVRVLGKGLRFLVESHTSVSLYCDPIRKNQALSE